MPSNERLGLNDKHTRIAKKVKAAILYVKFASEIHTNSVKPRERIILQFITNSTHGRNR